MEKRNNDTVWRKRGYKWTFWCRVQSSKKCLILIEDVTSHKLAHTNFLSDESCMFHSKAFSIAITLRLYCYTEVREGLLWNLPVWCQISPVYTDFITNATQKWEKDYCEIWRCDVRFLQCIQTLSQPSTLFFCCLHWLPVDKHVAFKILLLVYFTLNISAPIYLQSSLNLYKPPRNLRSSNSHSIQAPRVRHTWGDHAFSHMGPKLWNDLLSLCWVPSLDAF